MKRIISLLICMCICIVFPTPAFANVEFDISVFENNPAYTVEFDDMNDTGEITPAEGYIILGIADDDEGSLLGYFDIKIIENLPPTIRLMFYYIGEDWIFTEKLIIKIGDVRYTFEVDPDTDVEDGKIYEQFAIAITDENYAMLEHICNAEDFDAVRFRLNGDRDVDGYFIFDTEVLHQMCTDYIASGSLENDFSLLSELYPCTIKDMTSQE